MSTIRRAALRLAFAVEGHAGRNLRELRRWQWMPPAEARRHQQERLAGLLRHAMEHVPYYRDVLGGLPGLLDGGRVDPDAFLRVPLLERSHLDAHAQRLRSDDAGGRRAYANTSGGSTGEPVRFLQDAAYKDWNRAVKDLFDEWTGCAGGVRKALLWGSERDLFVGRETLAFRAKRWIKNEIVLNAFRMDEGAMRRHLERMVEFRPRCVQAYAESIYELARFAELRGLPVYSPGSILSSAGTLHPHMREMVERVFRTRVFNRYGSREFGGIACECERTAGLHVAQPVHYVEVLRPDGSPAPPGEVGEIVVTCLVNRTMPLIRYRIGDMATWSADPCPCGRAWPVLAGVHGRLADGVVRRDGGVVPPEYFIHLIGVVLNTGWIRRYQVEQESLDRLRVRIEPVAGDAPSGEELARRTGDIVDKVNVAMGGGCAVEVELVPEIPPAPSGKFRYVTSRVRGQAAGSQ